MEAYEEEYYDEPDMGVDSGGNPGNPVPIDQSMAVLLIAALILGYWHLRKP